MHKPSFASEDFLSPVVTRGSSSPLEQMSVAPVEFPMESYHHHHTAMRRDDEEKGFPINHICFDSCRHSAVSRF